jgi:hypothetical protein
MSNVIGSLVLEPRLERLVHWAQSAAAGAAFAFLVLLVAGVF